MKFSNMRIVGRSLDKDLYEISVTLHIEDKVSTINHTGVFGYSPSENEMFLVEYFDREMEDSPYLLYEYLDEHNSRSLALDLEYGKEDGRDIMLELMEFLYEKQNDEEFNKLIDKLVVDYQL